MTINNAIKLFVFTTLFFFAFEISFMEIELDSLDVSERGATIVIIQSCLQSAFITTLILYLISKIISKLKNNT